MGFFLFFFIVSWFSFDGCGHVSHKQEWFVLLFLLFAGIEFCTDVVFLALVLSLDLFQLVVGGQMQC